MTRPKKDGAKKISEIETGQDGESLRPQEHAQNSGVVGDVPRPKALRGVLERKWRRKNDINSLPGLIREHSRLISAMHNGRIRLDLGEVLSRAYSRHREMVSALEQRQQLAAITEQLKALRGEPSAQLMIDEARAKVSE